MAADGRTIDLPAHPSSVALARHLVRDVVSDSGSPELSGDAELLTSEVVTNALVHAGSSHPDHGARRRGSGVRVEVADGSPHSPIVREYGELAGTGRGLRLLDLLARWGVEETATRQGRLVRARARRGAAAHRPPAPDHSYAGPSGAAPGPDQVEITLLQVPLLLHAAWQMHAESFLREYLLIQLDELRRRRGDRGPRRRQRRPGPAQGAHPGPRARERPGPPDGGRHRGPGLGGPSSPSGCRASSVANFRCSTTCWTPPWRSPDEGGFLTPTIQPELRAMRRWLCASVEEQARGGDPRPWSLTSQDLDAPGRAPTDWDGSDVGGPVRP